MEIVQICDKSVKLGIKLYYTIVNQKKAETHVIWIYYGGHLEFQNGRPEKINNTISWVLCKVEIRF